MKEKKEVNYRLITITKKDQLEGYNNIYCPYCKEEVMENSDLFQCKKCGLIFTFKIVVSD